MKVIVDWILARRHRSFVLAAAAASLLPVVTTSLIALETLRSGVRDTLPGAAIAAGAVAAFWLAAGPSAQEVPAYSAAVAAVTVFSFGFGLGLGALLRWARGLAPAFRGVVLFCGALVLAVGAFGPGGVELLGPLFDSIVAIAREGGATDIQVEAFRGAEARVLGLLAAALLTSLAAALFLAYWLCGIAVGDTRFGEEFRALRLTPTIGIPATVLVTIGLVLGAPLVQNLATLALVGFLFQGLSVVHAWAHAKRWHAAFVALVYVLLVPPLTGMGVLALSAVGLMDNWFDLRAPLRPRA